MPEAKHDVNCDVKSNCNAKNGKSNCSGKYDIKCDVKTDGKWKQDYKQSTKRCKDCSDKYEKSR